MRLTCSVYVQGLTDSLPVRVILFMNFEFESGKLHGAKIVLSKVHSEHGLGPLLKANLWPPWESSFHSE